MPAKSDSHRLDRRAWVSAGIEVLCSAGVQAIRVEALAKKLDISKGSFYWHFKNREDLLEAILEEWQARQSDWNADGGGLQNPVERWTKLFDIFAKPGYARLELAMSAWARQDEGVARRVADADRKRVAYLSSIFREIGFSPSQATEAANAAFFLYLGWMDRTMRDHEGRQSYPPLAELLSRFVLAASALASQEALQQTKR
ncbi:MAG TPA: TetR/AcrR family transcriptional regulator [Candidatus Acidoferrales bacterium]|nr:TetR/AcrR family transcriptional regulator [Candidatus Acidoferrales bacterium]